MRNFTFNWFKFIKPQFLVLFFLLISYSASAQFYTKHYIAPAPWQYFSKANEIVIATNSTTTVNITLSKSNGTLVTNLTAVKGTPAVYRFAGLPKDAPAFALNTILNGAGLIINANAPVSINLRNVASDALGGDGSDQDIKGNAALTSFGDAGIGIRFRVGYYRDGSLGNFSGFGDQRPIYSIMATVDNTTVKINNAAVTTLNAGQSYLFKAAIGTLVESSNPVVMNTSAAIDMPDGCGDGAFNQIPPESVLGTEYFIERGKGNDTAEQTTVVATKDNTVLTIDTYSTTGALVGTTNVTLATAGSFYTFRNGVSNTSFSASRVFADKKIVVYSGTAQSCEVDISTIAPVSECGGSNFIETAKFRNYGTGSLPYFGYILLRSATDVVSVNGTNIETVSGIAARHQLGTTGWYIINFEDTQIGSPNILSISSAAKLTVSIVQQGGGFSMAGFFSNFAVQPEDPTMTYISGGGCTNNKAELTTPAGFAPYQWYFNGTAIAGANSSTYTATKTGAYSVASTLTCGAQTQSKPVSVTLCTDLGITKTVDNATPCIGSNVEFTIKVSNLGGNNISGVSVNDLLPSGYTYGSSTPSAGAYDSATGIWSIGDIDAQTSATLKIIASINASGNYTNTASLPSSIDTNTANNSASAAVTPKSSIFVVTNPATVCAPSTVDLTAPAVTAGSTPNMTLSYWTDANASVAYTTPAAVTTSGTYYIKAVSADGCQFIKPVVVTINAQAGTPTISASGSTTCATGSVVLTSSGNSGTYLWSTGETTKSITVTANGSYTVKRINAAGCPGNSSVATVVTFTPAAPTASAQTFCSSENKKVSDLVASGTNLKWYSAATGGTALPAAQALATGDYYASQTVSGCESSRTQVSVTINTTSSAPVASSQTFCAADNKKVSDLVAAGTNLKWYNVSSGGTALPANQILTSGNYYVSQTANSCGESTRTLVVVTINTVPAAPAASSQTFCAIDAKKVSDLAATGTNLKWYNAATNGTLYTGTETLVTGTYYVSQSTNSCGESPRTSVAVTVNNTAAPTASSQTFCAIDAKKVSDLAASGTNLKWYSANTGGTLYTGTETLTSGNYYVSQTLNSCESTRTLVSVTVNNTPAPTASSQTFCAADAKKVSDLTATGTNLKWYSASTGGTLYTGTETLISANYYVSQTLTGCESARTLVSVTVNPTPSAPTITANGPTTFCSGGSVILTSSGGNSYLWSTGATTQSITVSASGNYSVRIANASGCQSAASAITAVTVNPIPAVPTLNAVTQPTCSTATGSFTISNYSASNTYAVSPSTGVTQSGNTITAPAGSYTVTAAANGCTSAASSAAVINAQPATPAVPILSAVTQPTCSTAAGSFTISNYNASNTYAVSPSTGVTQSGNTITAPAGSYTVTAAANGCTSAASSAAMINAQPATPAVPTLSAVTQPTCSTAAGSFTISNYSASNTYAVSPSTGVTQSGNTITAPAGSYTVTAAANGCTSAASSAAVINAQPATPAVPTLSAVTQPTCSTAAGSFTISNYNASNTYAVSPSTGVTQSGNTITAPAGSYTVTAAANGCTSAASSAAMINAQPATPAVPTLSAVTQPTCSTAAGSFTISNYSASNTYAVSPSTGVTQSGNTITAPAGSYTVTAAANGCTSAASSAAVINAQPATPAVPTLSAVTQPTCSTAAGSFTISNYSASNTYAVSPSTGVTQSGNTITAPAGSYTVTASANGCTSAASSAAVINAQPATPAVPTLSAVTQPTCSTAAGSFTISNYSASNTYAVSPSTGVTQSGNTITAPAGSYTVTASANGCTSAASSAAVINAQPATPAVPTLSAVTQPTCSTAAGSFTISNYNASNTYAVSPSTGVTQSGNTITAPAGSYTVTAAANGCTSAASSAAMINAQPATPAVPTLSAVTQPTCSTAAGSFTISNYSASNTYAVSPSTGVTQSGNTITAPAGSYTITAAANGCTSAASSAAVINAQPATPAVPTLSAVTQPTCSTAAGSFTISNYNASNTYAVSPSTGVTQSGNTITAPAGSYTVTASANGCTSAASSAAVINAQPATPAVPTLSAVTQPTCSTAAGSFTISNYSASNTYAVSPSTGVTQSGNTITAPAGSYTVTAAANGCTSAASSAAVINAQPATPAVPTLSAVTQPTCSTAAGSFTISNYSASNTYAVSPSTGVTQSGNTITAPAGSYTVTAAANGCTSAASSAAMINAQPATPAVPTLSAVTQPTCSTAAGSFTISNYSASNTYAVSPSTGVTQSGNTITAPAGSYTVTAAANGCTSAASSAAVINAQPATPAVPTLSAVTQPTCSTAAGSFTISNYSASNTYAVSPSTGVTQSGNTITAPAGSYTVTASANGCTSAASSAAVISEYICAEDDAPSSVNGLIGGTISTVFANDNINGASFLPGDVTLTTAALPAGITFNSNGTITVAPNTSAGTHNIVYTICKATNSSICDSAIVTIVITAPIIDAVTETTASVNGNTGGTTAALTANDTLNGNPVVIGTAQGNVTLTAVSVPSGLTLNADGTVTVAANTVAGIYDIEYRICEVTNPANCDAVISKVTVTAPIIDAITETTASVNGNTGGTTAALTANDTLNGNPVVIGTAQGNVTLTAISVPAGLTLNADGTVTVAANTAAGTYDVEYSICELTNPSNCDAVISKVTVGAPVIDAVTETTTAINGNLGGITAALTANDTLNGNPVVIGTANGNVTLTAISVPSGLTLNSDGTVTVAANTAAGTYDVEYRICEVTNPSNCDAVISKVTVGAPVIDAVTETTAAVNGNTGGTTAALTANDTLNGNPVVIGTAQGNVTLTAISVPAGLTLNADGTVTVAANTAAGTYDVEYRICEVTNPSNCDAVISKVTVGAPVIDAVTETTAAINGNTGGTTAALTANDTLNGNPVVIGTSAGQVTLTAISVPAGLTLNADGTVTVAVNTAAGTYDVEYRICEVTNPANCDAVISKVVVTAATLIANADTIGSVTSGNTAQTLPVNVFDNDTKNGTAVVPSDVNLTTTIADPTGYLVLNPDGSLTLGANAPAGTYTLTYTICEKLNPSNCSSNTVSVTVGAPVIDAVTETTASINGNTGGTTAALTTNDTLNGNPVVIGTAQGNVTLTAISVPAGLTLNADGTVTVAANTAAGTYDVEYRICEVTNPSNCDAVISKVTVGAPVIDAVTETTAAINGNTGGTTAALTANDTLNGNPVVIGTSAGQVTLTAISVPSGLTLNTDGTVTVAANTAAGTYDVEYRICEVTNPANCDAVISKVVVTAATLIANADTIGSVTSGNTAQTLPVNVFDNDTKNGTALVPSDVNLTVSVPDPSGYLFLNPDGSLTLGANAPAGTYTLTYTICEKLNPSNCSSNTVSVTVAAPVIDAVTETTASVNGNTGGTTAALTANDTLNGNPVVIGTAQGNVTLTAISVPAGLTLNADGTVTVAANTAAGTYDIEYSICEVTNPANCDAVISKVVVTAASLIANADTIGSVTSGNTTQTLPVNVFDNDTKNGTALVPSDVNLTVSVPDPSGYLVLNPDGSLTLGANAPAGTYTLTYTICEKLNPSNCSSNTVSVKVAASVIDAVTETTAAITGNTGGTTAALTANDTLNGNPVVIGTAQGNVTLTAVSVPAGLTLNADGTVTVAANTAAGTYDVEYRICEVTNPSNCDAVISKVVVTAASLIANADTIGSVTSGNTTQTLPVNVFDNDTKNGTALVPSDVNLTVSVPDPSGYLVLNPDGSLTLGANAPAGTYTLTYTICEKLNPSNCSSNTVSVTVGAPVIDAVTETTASINGNTGGTTAALTTNDTLNGNPVVIGTAQGNVTLTAISIPAGLTLNADGTVTVAANTAAGTYDVEYRICEVTNPSNCDAVISKVTVGAPVIDAVTETTAAINGNTGGTTAALTANDTLNGNPVVIGTSAGQVTLTAISVPAGLTLNADGTVTVAVNTAAGTYDVEYRICEVTNPANCDAVISKVVVTAATLIANADTIGSVTSGNTAQTLPVNVFDNDTKNGTAVVPSDVNLTTTIADPTGYLVLNPDGSLTLGANAPAGTYTLTYTICEKLNPSNCSSNTVSVTVGAPVIDAVTETTASINGNTGGTTAALTTNDTLNGNPVVIGTAQGNVTLTAISVPAGLTLNADGTVTVAANTAAGTYDVEYRICEVTNPSNCDAVISKVTVGAPVIDAVTETTAAINGNTGGTTAALTANDTLNGNPVVIGTSAGQVTLTAISVPSGLTLNTDGTVTVAANTAAGTYDVEYRICEVTNPANCDAVISKVVVTAATLIANADTIGSVTSGNTAQTLPVNVFDNDTKNGTALVPSDVNLTVSVPDPSGYLFLNPDGSLTLGANAPAGTYTLTYTICEKLNPSNCSSNTVSVTVAAPVIDAVTETTASVNGNTGGTTAALTANDTLNGNPVVIGTAQGNVTLTAISVPAGLTLNADGTVTVAANTAAGTYDIEYSICEVTNPANCDAVISKVVVTAASLIANADTIGSVTSGNTTQTLPVNVFDNDTKNGTALVPSDVNLTTTTADPSGYLVLNPDGSLTLGANAPGGTYTLTYTICEKLNPSNCSSNTVSVTVGVTAPTPVIDAVTETTAAINGNLGGTTAQLTANDTLNGNPVVIGTSAGQVILTAISVPSGLTLNADGTVTVAANTAAGTYDVEYRICDVTNPSNCDAVISKVVVTAASLIANADTIGSVTSGNTAQTLPVNVFDNDTKNGTALVPSDVNLTTTTADPSGYLILNPDGSLTLGANAPAGTYTLTYTICEKLNPSNCSSNTVSVTVGVTVPTPVIDAVTETTAAINGNLGGTTAPLTANDTLNGNPVVIGTSAGQVTLTAISVPSGLTLNADGTVTVAANTAAGTYDVEYRICEVTNPSNCDAVISKVVVTSGALLQAIDDIVGSVVGVNHPQTVVNVFDNDTNNGLPVIANTLNLSVVTPDPTGFLTLNPDGTVTLGASAPRGDYTLTYTICEKLNPTNCSTASVKVTVDDPTMTVTANSYCSNNVPYVSYNVVADNFTPTNLLTIQWVDSANKVVATQTNLPLSGNILWPGAVVDGSGNGLDWPGWVNTNGQWTQGPDGFENTRPAVTMVFSLNPTVNVSVNYPTATAGCNARPTFEIKANNDTAGPIDITKGTSTGINVFTNDTHNGSAVIPANVILSTVLPNANLILNADGTVYIKPGTQTGNYQLTYQICDALSSSNCSQAVVSVDVLNTVIPVTPTKPIAANNDGEIAVDGINGSLEFINVLDNDLLDGLAVNPADVTITNTSNNTNFEFNADGTVNVKPNTPGGTYQITYEICEKAAATANCASATLSVFVEVPAIAIVKTAVFNNENKNNNADPGETITYKFVVTNTGNVPLKNITITDPLPGVIVSGQALDLGVGESNGSNFSAIYKITQTDINKGEVTNQASVKGNSAKGVVVEDLSDNEGVNGDQPTVITLNGCQIDVKKGMSPNGDGKNDRFYIQGIECYPDNTVEIYNRWGVLVFEKDGYNNEDRVFKGYSEGRTTIKQSDGLPAGTYFYILKYKDSGSNPHEKSGYLYINK